MRTIISPAYLPYITTAIAGITLSGDVLYLERVAEGTQLANIPHLPSFTLYLLIQALYRFM
jgi:hypothetical protein